MSNPVSILGASQGVCLLCGCDGPVFEATTPCGRLSAVPVCAKDLFAIIGAQHRAVGSATRGPTRSRGKPAAKPRSADVADGSRSAVAGSATQPESSAA